MSSSLHTLTRSSLTWSSPASCASISIHLMRYAGAMWSMASQRHAQASNEGGTHMKLWSAEGRRRCASEWLAPKRIFVLYCIGLQRYARVHPQKLQRVCLQEYKGYIPSHQREEGREGDWLPCIEKEFAQQVGETLNPSLALCYRNQLRDISPELYKGCLPRRVIQGISPGIPSYATTTQDMTGCNLWTP